MPTDLQPHASTPGFDEGLDSLRTLTRDFVLCFRLGAGELMLGRFYHGELGACRGNDPTKSAAAVVDHQPDGS